MRRIWASWVLALCLVLSQHGALLHALSHELPQAEASFPGDSDSRSDKALCVICLAFAHVVSLAHSTSIPMVLLAPAHSPPNDETWTWVPVRPPIARARDPPRGVDRPTPHH